MAKLARPTELGQVHWRLVSFIRLPRRLATTAPSSVPRLHFTGRWHFTQAHDGYLIGDLSWQFRGVSRLFRDGNPPASYKKVREVVGLKLVLSDIALVPCADQKPQIRQRKARRQHSPWSWKAPRDPQSLTLSKCCSEITLAPLPIRRQRNAAALPCSRRSG